MPYLNVRTQVVHALTLLAVFMFSPGRSVQAQKDVADSVRNWSLTGRTYLRYSYEVGEARQDYNEFAIDRLYLIFRWQLWERGALRYTLEGGDLRNLDVRLSDGELTKTNNQALSAATKHLYFEYQNPLGKDSWFRFGISDLPWVPYEEDLWGYRVQGTVFPDRSGYLSSADLGVAAGGKVPAGFGSWHVSLVNGETWRRSEAGKHKDLHARLTINPLAAIGGDAARFFLAAFHATGQYDDVTTGLTDRERTILQAGYKSAGNFTLVAEHLLTRDPASAMASRYPSLTSRSGLLSEGRGTSFFGTLSPRAFGATGDVTKLDLLLRYDALDPDDEVADNDVRRLIGGLAYRLHQKMTALVTMEDVRYEPMAGRPNERRLLVQAEVRFP